jgi:shikimate kinase
MGAGKSTVGKALANVLNRPFCDTDHMVEEAAGATVDTIFEMLGEEAFRNLETETIRELSDIKGAVIATGGGAIKNPANLTALKEGSFVVYLYAEPETLFDRITKATVGRPLAASMQSVEDLEVLLADRESQYRQAADLVVDTTSKNQAAVEHEIFKAIGY